MCNGNQSLRTAWELEWLEGGLPSFRCLGARFALHDASPTQLERKQDG